MTSQPLLPRLRSLAFRALFDRKPDTMHYLASLLVTPNLQRLHLAESRTFMASCATPSFGQLLNIVGSRAKSLQYFGIRAKLNSTLSWRDVYQDLLAPAAHTITSIYYSTQTISDYTTACRMMANLPNLREMIILDPTWSSKEFHFIVDGPTRASGAHVRIALDIASVKEILYALPSIKMLSMNITGRSPDIHLSVWEQCAELVVSRWSGSLRDLAVQLGITTDPLGSVPPHVSIVIVNIWFALPNLQSFAFQTSRAAMNLGHADVESMFTAWPNIRELQLSFGMRHYLPLSFLLRLPLLCPSLEELTVDLGGEIPQLHQADGYLSGMSNLRAINVIYKDPLQRCSPQQAVVDFLHTISPKARIVHYPVF